MSYMSPNIKIITIRHNDSDFLVTGQGRGMAACQEPIEWDYRDLTIKEATVSKDSIRLHAFKKCSQLYEL